MRSAGTIQKKPDSDYNLLTPLIGALFFNKKTQVLPGPRRHRISENGKNRYPTKRLWKTGFPVVSLNLPEAAFSCAVALEKVDLGRIVVDGFAKLCILLLIMI